MRHAKEPMPETVDALLGLAQKSPDPKIKREYLLRAEALSLQSLAVQKELLLLGDLWRRDGRNPRPDLIKCYLLHAFEHPQAHDEETQRRMARELFDHPQVQKCLALTKDAAAFLREYLEQLSTQYVEIFIQGQREHVPGFLGYALPRRLPRYWAAPMGDVIRNIFLCPFLSVAEQQMLAGAFYRACYRCLEGRTEALDRALGAEIRALLQ